MDVPDTRTLANARYFLDESAEALSPTELRVSLGARILTASVPLLAPRLRWRGALLALGAMGSEIASHLTVLGDAVRRDHGRLFGMACMAFAGALVTLWVHQQSVPHIARLDDVP
jgi:hypothetical protein